MNMILVLSLGCALVAVSHAQDMTSLMFQAMGIEMPPMPPQMPQSLREHFYPQQQQLRRQQLFKLQQAAAARAAALQSVMAAQKAKANPYSFRYNTATTNTAPEKRELLVSQANAIRRPGEVNSLINKANPYSTSRAVNSINPNVRNAALAARRAIPPRRMDMYRQYRQWREQPKKINEAQAAGCKLPIDSTAASILMFGDCRNPTARMVCQVEMMSCVNIGMSAMCCPFGSKWDRLIYFVLMALGSTLICKN
ncbi:hypothetical protein Btru_038650 [Bulinus truncatus]|nr:hypothetical protein Btru_038650 [Bulinus truncatus]